MRQYVRPGGIKQIDHVLFFCPEELEAAVREFWESLGLEGRERVEYRDIDHARAGRRIDFYVGGDTTITYRIAGTLDASSFAGHLAVRVGPQEFRALTSHPALDRTYGKNGLIRWGMRDVSLFLLDPVGIRFEFRCACAPDDLDNSAL